VSVWVFNYSGGIVRLYFFGAEGQIARSLREAATENRDLVIGWGSRPSVDLQRPDLVQRALADFSPDLVINPAAYTSVDLAESEPDLAFAVNDKGAGNVAAAAHALNAPIIHLSTDYVFDGNKDGPYDETDAVSPQTVYGRSKLAGEQAVAAANPRHIILRTSWVYAPFGANFVRTILRLAADRDKLSVVDDQIGCPTYAPDIANAILAIARKIGANGRQANYAGVTHLAGPDAVTWCSFARRILQASETNRNRLMAVDAITTADYPTPAKRPANSRLCCNRLGSVFGVRLPPLDQSLRACIDRLFSGSPQSGKGPS
jgi:dTDP-4-dehydrorhamnose reductase